MRKRQDLVELKRRSNPSERMKTRPLKLPWRRLSHGSRADSVGAHRADLDFRRVRHYGLDYARMCKPVLILAGATFRVIKQKEEEQFGEYRTRRLVLQAWERQQEAFRKRPMTRDS